MSLHTCTATGCDRRTPWTWCVVHSPQRADYGHRRHPVPPHETRWSRDEAVRRRHLEIERDSIQWRAFLTARKEAQRHARDGEAVVGALDQIAGSGLGELLRGFVEDLSVGRS